MTNGSTSASDASPPLEWRRCGDGWCAFATAVLPDAHASGILLVWSAESERAVYLGQGRIAKNLRWARQFKPLAILHDLLVTWATVRDDRQSGIRNYLLHRLLPVYSDPPTEDASIAVRLPWEDP